MKVLILNLTLAVIPLLSLVLVTWIAAVLCAVFDCKFAEAFEDEKLPNFIAGTVHALEYYGAVPKYLVPDNLKTAITRHTKVELVINSAYADLENFYDVVILPPPPRKPKGKPTVEKYVQFLETHLLEDLKEKVYYSIEDINRDVRQKIAVINNEKKTATSVSKMESFLR